MKSLFDPAGVVVIGASRQGGKLGASMARSLAGFPAGRALVNSRDPGPGVYASVAEAAENAKLDLAVLCVPAAACAGAVREAAAVGVSAALVCAGGFGEIGEAGHAAESELRQAIVDTGVRLLGPNTSGFLVPRRGLTASFVPGVVDVPAGDIAVVAASGGVNHALCFELANAGNGISLGVGIGAGLDVTAADVLDYLADDPDTTAVVLHLETVPDGARLVAAIRQLSAVKPVVALVVGRTDVGDFARSHTGALATSWRTTRAVIRQAGAVVVDTERELVDAVTALSRIRLRPSTDPGVGVVTAQAGPGLLLVDRLGAAGIGAPELTAGTQRRLAELLPPMTYQRNPVDTGRPGSTFAEVLRSVAADRNIDLLTLYALVEPDSVDLVASVPTGTPVVVAVGGLADQVGEQRAHLHKIGIPTVTTPSAAADAVRALVADADIRATTGPPVAGVSIPDTDAPLDEDAAKNLLARLNIATPARRACGSPEQAHAALAELGGPVVVKVLDAAVSHKTELGGVHLNIRTPTDLDDALRSLHGIGARRYLVETMAPAGLELVVGARRDPVFGPIVLLGLGGITAEALADVAIRLAPLSVIEAAAMREDLAGRTLLAGWRGGPAADPAELGGLVAALGGALAANPWLAEIEINPLRVTADGLLALDAVVVRTEDS